MRLYLDACCLNRPFDDQSQLRIHLESEAVLAICEGAEQGRWILLASAALDFELAQTSDPQRRARTQKLSSLAHARISVGPSQSARAKVLQKAYGLHARDALHFACAETLHADIFLTTDDRLLRAYRRMSTGELPFVAANPLAWLTDFLEHG